MFIGIRLMRVEPDGNMRMTEEEQQAYAEALERLFTPTGRNPFKEIEEIIPLKQRSEDGDGE